jgi:glycosyltransferase involved in cell wall biosynthesis
MTGRLDPQPAAPDPRRPPDVSVVLSTYNRGALLRDAIDGVLDQRAADTPPFELLVVDNNSTDQTRAIIEAVTARDARVRHVLALDQGLSHARNAGIAESRAPIVTFTDDDVRVPPDWVAGIVRAFREFPDADFVGGPVLPDWPSPPPAWLTRAHWAPLALVNYADQPVRVSAEHPLCLIGANFSFRREVFERVGLFGTDFQRVKDTIGSLEDHEFLLRLFRLGRYGVYDPRLRIHAEVQPGRLERAYHRRWHTGHGHFHALLKSEEMERSAGTVFGVPLHLYRQAGNAAIGWLGAAIARREPERFGHELRLRFFSGFFRTRRREFRARGGSVVREVTQLARGATRRAGTAGETRSSRAEAAVAERVR